MTIDPLADATEREKTAARRYKITVMLGTLESDLATSIAVLDRLPANERPDWLDRLSRGNYRLVLGPGLPGVPDTSNPQDPSEHGSINLGALFQIPEEGAE